MQQTHFRPVCQVSAFGIGVVPRDGKYLLGNNIDARRRLDSNVSVRTNSVSKNNLFDLCSNNCYCLVRGAEIPRHVYTLL